MPGEKLIATNLRYNFLKSYVIGDLPKCFRMML